MILLFDTNIIIDIILVRLPFFQTSSQAFELINRNRFKGCVTASSVTDIYYIVKKSSNHNKAISFIELLMLTVDVLNVNKGTVVLALQAISSILKMRCKVLQPN